MELKVIGTGSAGNSYILENDDTALIIEAGISFKEVKKAMDFKTQKIIGVLISHSHQDHSKYIKEYQQAGIKCFMYFKTFEELDLGYEFIKLIDFQTVFRLGEFVITTFDLIHDVYCMGFQINHKDFGKAIFITDTKYCPYKFQDIKYWIVECNHSIEILNDKVNSDELNVYLANRISENHLSLESLLEMFNHNDLVGCNGIILTHASDNNSHTEHFKNKVVQSTGVQTHVASKGLKLNL